MPQAALSPPESEFSRLRPRVLGRLAEAAFWGSLALVLAYFIATGDWIGAAAILALAVLGVVLVMDMKTLALIWVVGQPTVFVFPNNVAAGVPFFTVERGLFLILLGLTILRGLTRSGVSRPMNRLDWTALGFVGVLTLSFVTTLPFKDMKIVRSDVALLFQCYLMPWLSIIIARRIDWTEQDVLRLLRLVSVSGVVLVIFGILQYFLRVQWFTPRSFEVIHEGRTTGTFGNAAEYGSVLSGMALLTLAQFANARDPLFRAILLGCFGAMVAAVLLALTRSPLVGLAAALLVVFVGDPRIRPFLIAIAVIGFAAAMVIVPLVMDVDALTSRFEEMEPIYNRITLFATAGKMIAAHPVAGVGFGRYGFSDNKTDYLTGVGSIGAEWAASIGIPHLEFIHIAVLTGLLGIALYILALKACFSTLWTVYQDASAPPLIRTMALYVLALLVSLITNGLFVDFMAYNYFASLVYFLVGVTSVAHPVSTHPSR